MSQTQYLSRIEALFCVIIGVSKLGMGIALMMTSNTERKREQIFQRILEDCYRFKLVDPTAVFVDATHVKARANNRKMQHKLAKQEALFYEEMLRKEINEDRAEHGKKPLKDKDDDNDKGAGGHDDFSDYTEGMKDLYSHRKETIERIFGTAKENHGFRYTQMYGKARMEMKAALTFACMNLKKLAKIKHEWRLEMA